MEFFVAPLVVLAFGAFFFLVGGGPQACIKAAKDGRVKVAEANARAEEAKLARARLEYGADKQS